MANRSDDRSVGLRTRSSSQAQDLSTEIRDLIQKEIGNFLKSSDFRELLKDAVKDAIRDEIVKATGPLKEEIAMLKAELSTLKEKANDNEQYSRRSNIRIFGLKEDPDENCHDTVIEFFSRDLGVTMSPNEIDRVHRVGRRRDLEARPMIVKFRSHNAKVTVMRKKRTLRGKRIYINEDLTKPNLDLLKAT